MSANISNSLKSNYLYDSAQDPGWKAKHRPVDWDAYPKPAEEDPEEAFGRTTSFYLGSTSRSNKPDPAPSPENEVELELPELPPEQKVEENKKPDPDPLLLAVKKV